MKLSYILEQRQVTWLHGIVISRRRQGTGVITVVCRTACHSDGVHRLGGGDKGKNENSQAIRSISVSTARNGANCLDSDARHVFSESVPLVVVPLILVIHTAYAFLTFPAQLASFPSHHEEVWSMAAPTTHLSTCLYLHIERAPPHRHTFNTGRLAVASDVLLAKLDDTASEVERIRWLPRWCRPTQVRGLSSLSSIIWTAEELSCFTVVAQVTGALRRFSRMAVVMGIRRPQSCCCTTGVSGISES